MPPNLTPPPPSKVCLDVKNEVGGEPDGFGAVYGGDTISISREDPILSSSLSRGEGAPIDGHETEYSGTDDEEDHNSVDGVSFCSDRVDEELLSLMLNIQAPSLLNLCTSGVPSNYFCVKKSKLNYSVRLSVLHPPNPRKRDELQKLLSSIAQATDLITDFESIKVLYETSCLRFKFDSLRSLVLLYDDKLISLLALAHFLKRLPHSLKKLYIRPDHKYFDTRRQDVVFLETENILLIDDMRLEVVEIDITREKYDEDGRLVERLLENAKRLTKMTMSSENTLPMEVGNILMEAANQAVKHRNRVNRDWIMDVSSLSKASTGFLSSKESLLLDKSRVSSSNLSRSSISLHQSTGRAISLRFRSPLQIHGFIKVSCSQQNDVPIVEARTMNEVYDALALRIVPSSAASSNPNFKYIVGLAGPPGAGKSTLASEVVKRINKLWPEKGPSFDEEVKTLDVAIVLPMDGFHLYRSQLDAMEDPKEAHARRGAPWTFDPNRLLNCLHNLRNQGSVYWPSFDHGVGDPVEDDIFVSLQHKVIIVEGNYLFLEDGEWKDVSSMFDEKWFIEVDLDKAMQRVLKRHISTGKPPDVAKSRIHYNDRPNAELIMKSKINANLITKSIDI
ncbi:hypothetical protein ACFE04_031579 [Oxalis oulophora]